MLTLKDALRQLFRDMRSQKLRTLLTVFGIVWGTVAVTLLGAFGQGLHKQIVKNSAGLGDRIAIAWPGLTSIPYEGLGRGRRIRLQEEQIEAVRREAAGVVAVSSEYADTLKLHYGLKTVAVDVSGVWPEFGAMRNLIPDEGGRFINALDQRDQRRALFLGDKIAKEIFGKPASAVGKTVIFGGSPFTIVGVLQSKVQNSSYNSRDEGRAYMPGSTFRALTGSKYVNNFVYQPASPSESEAVTENVRAVLARQMRFDPKDKEALSVWDTAQQFKFLDIFFLSFRLFLGIVGCFTLVVGGIGVSNIMNVVVEERTKEIGIKMALGAKQRWVLRQLILETILITAMGGAAGFAISWGVCAVFPKFGVTKFVGDPEISLPVAALTAVVLGVTGLLAGYFPAREASRLDPVVAMKL
ncbi:MAG TPA: ABC transporter permease [Thermoanaerobaculia bacterium]|jgi:putative ABC transport system permease protein|nr:ABC transporter permease [Thermoanaerobaculia bacterium]